MYEINTSVKFSLKKKTCHENDALFHTTKYLTCSLFDWGVFMCAYSCGQNIQNSGNSFPSVFEPQAESTQVLYTALKAQEDMSSGKTL